MMQKIQIGFSLIELLVVVAIIGILAAIGTIGYNKYTHQAKVAASTANAKLIADAVTAEDTKLSICVAGPAGECAQKVARQFNIPTENNLNEDCMNIVDDQQRFDCFSATANVVGLTQIRQSEQGVDNELSGGDPEYAIFHYQTGHNLSPN